MSERDKALTEAMGLCCHESRQSDNGQFRCASCNEIMGYHNINYNFSTWEGFGVLWEFAQKQDWWNTFALKYTAFSIRRTRGDRTADNIHLQMINPDRFADAVYEFLKARHD